MQGETVLITGGAGFIGSHLADESLSRQARKVIILDNFTGGRECNIAHLSANPRVEVISGDVRDPDTIRPLVNRAGIVFNEAASKLVVSRERPRIDLETNILGTFNVLQAAKDCGGKKCIIHASTGSVLGSADDREMREDHPQNPSTLYGISKGAAERYCTFFAREFNLPVSTLRYFHVFGPRQDFSGEAGVVSIFLGRVLSGQNPIVFGSGEQIRCLTYVKDDVCANFLLLDELSKGRLAGEIFNVASKTRISVLDLAKKIVQQFGAPGQKPEFGPPRLGENLRPIPDTSKIESLGFSESISFDEGLELTKEWVEFEQSSANNSCL